MYKAIVNSKEFAIKPGKSADTFILDGQEILLDILKIKDGSYHIIQNFISYNVEINSLNHDEKVFTFSINGNHYSVQIKDQYDELLQRLGMDSVNSKKINELKAPMPGLVTGIHIEEGQKIMKGDVLLTLEAMKMENTLKAAADAQVKKIVVKKGSAVEKNEILIYFS